MKFMACLPPFNARVHPHHGDHPFSLRRDPALPDGRRRARDGGGANDDDYDDDDGYHRYR